MYADRNAPLAPRNGHTLIAGIGGRISGCNNQKAESLEDQVDHGKEVVADLYTGPVEYRIITTTGKGERLDRPELAEIEAHFRKRELDIFVWEDLGRLVRGAEAARLLGIGVDNGVRILAPNDCIDTAEATWEEDALNACAEHVGHNAHTSKRIKHKLMNRFTKYGGSPARPIAGYDVPKGAKTYDAWALSEAATQIINHGLQLLRQDGNCETVAEYFNTVPWGDGIGFPVGPYCRNHRWDGKMVRRFYKNRLLGGAPGRGFRHTVKHHETGRRVSVPNPKGPKFRHYPHLAHVDLAELDEVNLAIGRRNTNLGRKHVNGVDSLYRVSRKGSLWPALQGRCWYCGNTSVWGANGVTEHLMCSGSRSWECWCSIGYDGQIARERVLRAFTDVLYGLQGFDDQFRDLVCQARQGPNTFAERQATLRREEAALEPRRQNVQEMMAAVGAKPMVLAALAEIEAEESRLAVERRALAALAGRRLDVPESAAALRSLLEEKFLSLATSSSEFNRLLRRLVPRFDVHLVRLCDGGHLLPRAEVTLALDGIVPDAKHVDGLPQLLRRDLGIDLFIPPQRERIRPRVVELAAHGMGPKAIAAQIACEAVEQTADRPTATAVQNALALHRQMQEMGLSSPYVAVLAPLSRFVAFHNEAPSEPVSAWTGCRAKSAAVMNAACVAGPLSAVR